MINVVNPDLLDGISPSIRYILTDIRCKPIRPKKTLFMIALEVCSEYPVSISQIRSSSRKEEVVYVRNKFVEVAKREYEYTLQEIGSFLGGRDHSSIVHSLNNYRPPHNIEHKLKHYEE